MTKTTDLTENAKAHAADLSRTAKEAAAARVAHESANVQNHAADEVQQAADAATSAANSFDPGTMQAEAARQVAHQLEAVARQIRTADLDDTVRQVSSFARRNPALFIGAAALAGFAATRFLKARDPQRPVAHDYDDPWSSPSDPGPAYAGHGQAAMHGSDRTGVLGELDGGRDHGTA